MECLKCDADVSELVNYETIIADFITCPKCGNKMTVEYEETWDGEEEQCYWSLVQFEYTEPTMQDSSNAI